MRKAPAVSELRENVKSFKILVVVNAAALGLTAVWLLWSWSSTPDLARRDFVLLDSSFGLGLTLSIRMLFTYRRQLDSLAGTE